MPARAWTLALLELVSAVVLLVSAAFPLSAQAPVHLDEICAAALLVLGIITFLGAARLGDSWLTAQAACGVVITVALAASASTAGGTLLSCAGFVWIALWVALFQSPGRLAMTLGLELLGIPVATAVSAQPLRALAATASIVVVAAASSAVLAAVIGNLRQVAVSDHLTGLLNRYGLARALEDVAVGRPASLVAIDLDGLKAVNDRDGHSAGDELLADFAAEVAGALRRTDFAARTGGDEFVIVLPAATEASARRWADRLQHASRSSWSFGVAERRPGEPVHAWLERADQALYRAKRRTRAGRLSA